MGSFFLSGKEKQIIDAEKVKRRITGGMAGRFKYLGKYNNMESKLFKWGCGGSSTACSWCIRTITETMC